MKLLALLLFYIGIALIIITFATYNKSCPPPQIIYKFVPRTFQEEQENPVKASEIFQSMFEKPSPFIERALGKNTPSNNINRFFISQG